MNTSAQTSIALSKWVLLIVTLAAGHANAELPRAPEAARAQAAEAAAKTAWSDKTGQYQLCLAMDRTAAAYRQHLRETANAVPATVTTAPCIDPGPYVSPLTAAGPKPLEASGAHSPAATATSPPSTNATAAELLGAKKQ